MDTLASPTELERKFEENPRRYFAALADFHRRAGRLEHAIEILERHLREQPGHLSGHVVLGNALLDAGRIDESERALERAIELDPMNVVALRLLGDVAARHRETARAISLYRRALEIDPNDRAAASAMATLDSIETPALDAPPAAADSVAEPAPPELEPAIAENLRMPPFLLPADADVEPAELERAEIAAIAAEEAAIPTPASLRIVEQSATEWAEPVEMVEEVVEEPRTASSEEIGQSIVVDERPFDHQLPEGRGFAGETPAWEPKPAESSASADLINADARSSQGLSAAEPLSEVATPVPVTETMADLYLEQGHRDLAADILNQLLAQRPYDERLRSRLASLGTPPAEGPTVRDFFAAFRREAAAPSAPAPFESPPAPAATSGLSAFFGADPAADELATAAAAVAASRPSAPRPTPAEEMEEFDAWLKGLRSR